MTEKEISSKGKNAAFKLLISQITQWNWTQITASCPQFERELDIIVPRCRAEFVLLLLILTFLQPHTSWSTDIPDLAACSSYIIVSLFLLSPLFLLQIIRLLSLLSFSAIQRPLSSISGTSIRPQPKA